MADKGMIFSAPMVRALLAGRKSQTRRLLGRSWPVLGSSWRGKSAPWEGLDFDRAIARDKNTMAMALYGSDEAWVDPHLDVPFLHPEDSAAGKKWEDDPVRYRVRPPFEVGDRLYVREAWSTEARYDHEAPRNLWAQQAVFLHADQAWLFDDEDLRERPGAQIGKRRPGMFMPRWASRLTLLVSEVRVQRLQEISEDDAVAEGVLPYKPGYFFHVPGCPGTGSAFPVLSYQLLWASLHTKSGERWADNPWVVAVSFSTEQRNIDAGAA